MAEVFELGEDEAAPEGEVGGGVDGVLALEFLTYAAGLPDRSAAGYSQLQVLVGEEQLAVAVVPVLYTPDGRALLAFPSGALEYERLPGVIRSESGREVVTLEGLAVQADFVVVAAAFSDSD